MEKGSVVDAQQELWEQELNLMQDSGKILWFDKFLIKAKETFCQDFAEGICSGTPTVIKYKHLPIV